MIPIKLEEWEEISKEEYKSYLLKSKGLVPIIEHWDGENWRIYAQKMKGGLQK